MVVLLYYHAMPSPSFASRLLRWYSRHGRKLPFRGPRDPYRVWVSEIMLQQTRVETVIPYYRRWMKQFPTVKALASARQAEILKLWEVWVITPGRATCTAPRRSS